MTAANRYPPLKTVAELVQGDLLYSTLHRCYVRFARRDGCYVVVADRNTMRELPDYCHETQVVPQC